MFKEKKKERFPGNLSHFFHQISANHKTSTTFSQEFPTSSFRQKLFDEILFKKSVSVSVTRCWNKKVAQKFSKSGPKERTAVFTWL